MKKLPGTIALVASLAMAGEAQAACVSDATYEAAQMRDFDTMLMVQTLRCRIKDIDFSDDYNRFVRDKRPILAAANVELRNHFAQSVGQTRAIGAYDDFMTKVANGYGGGTVGMTCRDYADLARAAANAPASRSALIDLADRAGARPRVPGQSCEAKIALNRNK